MVRKCMVLFLQDADEICKAKGIAYPLEVARQVIAPRGEGETSLRYD